MKRMGLAVSATLAMGALMACIVLALETQSAAGRPAQVPSAGKAAELATAVQIEPEVLAKLLQGSKTGTKPVVLHVGFKNFYDQARIPGSYYAGPGFRPEGLELLRQRVASLQPEQLIVLYCGCCPWDKCPNVKPAYDALGVRAGFRDRAMERWCDIPRQRDHAHARMVAAESRHGRHAVEPSDGVYGFANADEVRSHIRRRPPRQRYLKRVFGR